MANPNNTIVPPPQMAMQVTTDKPLCKCSQTVTKSIYLFFCQGSTANKATTAAKEWYSLSTQLLRSRTPHSRRRRSHRTATAYSHLSSVVNHQLHHNHLLLHQVVLNQPMSLLHHHPKPNQETAWPPESDRSTMANVLALAYAVLLHSPIQLYRVEEHSAECLELCLWPHLRSK